MCFTQQFFQLMISDCGTIGFSWKRKLIPRMVISLLLNSRFIGSTQINRWGIPACFIKFLWFSFCGCSSFPFLKMSSLTTARVWEFFYEKIIHSFLCFFFCKFIVKAMVYFTVLLHILFLIKKKPDSCCVIIPFSFF